MTNNLPVILVHGLLGFGPQELGELSYWGSAMEVPSPLPRFEASVGPISSVHDRACELAAQIKGVQVDYGGQHAAASGHDRYGRDYGDSALHPRWNAHNPVHLVGHSLGAPTSRALQNLLEDDHWGWGSSARWIRSITSIAGSLNGSTAVYYFGADQSSGLLRRAGGIGPILKLLELYTAYNGRTLDSIYDFDLDHWGFIRQPDEGLTSYLQRVSASQLFWGPDNAIHSASLQAAYRDNGRWRTFPDTSYFSYVAEQTLRLWPRGYYVPSPLMNPALQPTAWYIGHKRFEEPPIPDADFQSSDWWENDGLLSTYSQTYPRTNGNHPHGGEISHKTRNSELRRGRWYVQWERGFDHSAICGTPRIWQWQRQRRLYETLFLRLGELDT
jgi:triacylglycerol lipase